MSGCSGGCCSSAPPCPCKPEQTPQIGTLEQVVACFRERRAGLFAEQAYFSSLPSLRDAISEAVQALGEENGLRPGDTPPAPQAVIDRLQSCLLDAEGDLAAAADFAALYACIATHCDTSPLDAYDVALRIALFRDLQPDRILIHAGNREAAAALCGDLAGVTWLDPAALPAALQGLSATEAELLLSVCARKLQSIAPASD